MMLDQPSLRCSMCSAVRRRTALPVAGSACSTVLLLLCLLTGGGPAGAQTLAGVGRAELTPAAGTPLAGYANRFGKPSTGDHDPLFAKALVLDDGKTRVAVVTTDLIGTHPDIKRRVCQRTGFA